MNMLKLIDTVTDKNKIDYIKSNNNIKIMTSQKCPTFETQPKIESDVLLKY